MMTTMVIMILIMIIKFGDLLMIAMMMTATTIGDLNLPISIGMNLTEGGGIPLTCFSSLYIRTAGGNPSENESSTARLFLRTSLTAGVKNRRRRKRLLRLDYCLPAKHQQKNIMVTKMANQ